MAYRELLRPDPHVGFPAWNPVAAHEWRGIATVRALRVLRANGRL